VIWRPERLTAKLILAATPARRDFARAAALRAKSSRVSQSIRVLGESVVATHALAPIEEKGARAHTIEPKQGRVLKMADGGFVTGPVRHPGRPARPFLRPTLPLWAPLYRRHAVGAFRGF
jgi:hypothetical protein